MLLPALAADPIVIAHRGQSGTLPDHTLAAYRRAVALGADYLEPDLVPTKDHVLVARHDAGLASTTDVAERFPDRQTTKTIDGETLTDWFVEDFTLAELRTLRARQPMEDRPHDQDGEHPIPTFDEVLDLRADLEAEHGRPIGVYPETKHPSYYDGLGLSLEEPLLASLAAHGLTTAESPVFIQSFEVGNLKELAGRTRVRLAQLVWTEGAPVDQGPDGWTWARLLTPEGLAHVATYAQAIAPDKSLVIPWTETGLGEPTRLVADAHAAGLLVHAYTFRSEARYLPPGTEPVDELRAYFAAGIDGAFCDFSEVGRIARKRFSRRAGAARRRPSPGPRRPGPRG